MTHSICLAYTADNCCLVLKKQKRLLNIYENFTVSFLLGSNGCTMHQVSGCTPCEISLMSRLVISGVTVGLLLLMHLLLGQELGRICGRIWGNLGEI